MPTTNVSTVGTGGDYATWVLWEAATDNDLVTLDVIERGDGLTETLSGAATTVTGATTDATRYRIMRSQTSHAGVYGAGHILAMGGATLTLGEANLVVQDMTITHTGASTNAIGTTAGPGSILRCFLISTLTSTATYVIRNQAAYTIRGCVIVGFNYAISNEAAVALEVSNCTIIGRSNIINTSIPQFGIRQVTAGGVTTAKNCLISGFERNFLASAGTLTQSNNISRDGSADGAGSLIGQIESDYRFRAKAGFDFTPLSSSVAAGAGADLSADFNYDISNTAMPTSWPIGAFRPAAAPTFAGLTSATNNSDGSIVLAWSAATANASAIRGYKVHVHTAEMVDADLDADTYLLAETPAGDTSVDIWTTADGVTALVSGTTYYFAVRAISDDGDEDQNATNKSATPTNATAPVSSLVGRVTAVTATTATVTLVAAPTANITRWLLLYRLYDPRNNGAWTRSSYNTTLTGNPTIQLTGLTANKRYEIVVAGDNAGAEGDPGSLLTAYTTAYSTSITSIETELSGTVAGLGFDAVDVGRRFPRVTAESHALVRYRGRKRLQQTGGLTLWRYDVDILAAYRAIADQPGSDHTDEIEARFEALKEQYHEKGGADIAGIAGLLRVTIDADEPDIDETEEGVIVGRVPLGFEVWEAHNG